MGLGCYVHLPCENSQPKKDVVHKINQKDGVENSSCGLQLNRSIDTKNVYEIHPYPTNYSTKPIDYKHCARGMSGNIGRQHHDQHMPGIVATGLNRQGLCSDTCGHGSSVTRESDGPHVRSKLLMYTR